MRHATALAALAMGALVTLSGSAPAQSVKIEIGNRPYHRRTFYRPVYLSRPYYRTYRPAWSYPIRTVAPVRYRDYAVSDVDDAERLVNDFRAIYEQEGDPWGMKPDVQRMDEAMEQMRAEVSQYGRTTRSVELLRRAQAYADRIDRRFDSQDGRLTDRWREARRALNRLASDYR